MEVIMKKLLHILLVSLICTPALRAMEQEPSIEEASAFGIATAAGLGTALFGIFALYNGLGAMSLEGKRLYSLGQLVKNSAIATTFAAIAGAAAANVRGYWNCQEIKDTYLTEENRSQVKDWAADKAANLEPVVKKMAKKVFNGVKKDAAKFGKSLQDEIIANYNAEEESMRNAVSRVVTQAKKLKPVVKNMATQVFKGVKKDAAKFGNSLQREIVRNYNAEEESMRNAASMVVRQAKKLKPVVKNMATEVFSGIKKDAATFGESLGESIGENYGVEESSLSSGWNWAKDLMSAGLEKVGPRFDWSFTLPEGMNRTEDTSPSAPPIEEHNYLNLGQQQI
jgi:hypothetical protein